MASLGSKIEAKKMRSPEVPKEPSRGAEGAYSPFDWRRLGEIWLVISPRNKALGTSRPPKGGGA